MALGKDSAGRTVGPSPAQRAINAKRVARYPLRKVVTAGVGADPERPHSDVDVLECGHVLSGAHDLVGRYWPGRRRCWKCEPKPCKHEWRPVFGGGEVCLICEETR